MQREFIPPVPRPESIEGPAGILEARVEEPAPGSRPSVVGVVCHPHPLHGGTMQNKVVHTLGRAMQELGAPTVRFNFRGVGASAGAYDAGRGEVDDAVAVVGGRGPDGIAKRCGSPDSRSDPRSRCRRLHSSVRSRSSRSRHRSDDCWRRPPRIRGVGGW